MSSGAPSAFDVTRTPVGSMWRDDRGLLWHRLDPDIVVRAEHAPAVACIVERLSGGRPVRAVVDISGVQFADRAARDAFSRVIDDSLEVATAVIVGTTVSQILGTLFLKLSRPSRPVRLFAEPHDGAEWVSSVAA